MTNCIRVSIPIKTDTYNSYPEGEITFHLSTDKVFIQISDSDREISVSRKDFKSLVYIINLPINDVDVI